MSMIKKILTLLLFKILISAYLSHSKVNLNFVFALNFDTIFFLIVNFNWFEHEEWWTKDGDFAWLQNIMHEMHKISFTNTSIGISIPNYTLDDKYHV
jgi:hypothetical protein